MKLCHFLPQLFSLFSSKLTLKNDIFCPVPIFLHDFLSIYFQLFDKHPHFFLYSQRIFANFFSNNIHHFTIFLDDLTTTFSSNKSQCISLSIFQASFTILQSARCKPVLFPSSLLLYILSFVSAITVLLDIASTFILFLTRMILLLNTSWLYLDCSVSKKLELADDLINKI